MGEAAVSNQCVIFPCFINVIVMIRAYRCNYLVYGPQECSWVLDCYIGPHADVLQVVSCGILVFHGFFVFSS